MAIENPPIVTGTWTPVLTFNNVDITDPGVGGALTIQGARWGKIGPFVLITANILITTLGTPTGSMKIIGFPFDSDTTYAIGFTCWDTWNVLPVAAYWESCIIATTPSQLLCDKFINGSATAITATDVAAGASMIITGFYMTAA